MANKIDLVSELSNLVTLPPIGGSFTQEEADKFLSVLSERATELQLVLKLNEVKASLKGVSVKGGDKVEYSRPEGDWRDGILDCVSRIAKVSAIVSGLKVDVSGIALRWASRRLEKRVES